MTTRKRQKRQESTAEEYSLGVARAKELEAMEEVRDEELFVVDRGGSKTAKRKIEVQEKQAAQGSASRTERKLVRKVVQKSAVEVAEQPATSGSAVGDIWGEEGARPSRRVAGGTLEVRATRSKRLVVRPGQSYNPATADHQDLLAEALALEIQKKEKDARAAGKVDLLRVPAPPETDISKFGESDSEDSGDSGDEDGDGETQVGSRRSRRKGSKFTRAQRNKMRTRKIKSFAELKQKQELSLLKEIDSSGKILESIEKEEESERKRRELLELQKAEEAVRDAARLSYAEAAAVPLSDELRGSLRQITAKGLRIGDKVNEMRSNGQLSKRDRKRKHFEAPHGASKLVWIPKYKY